MAGLQEQVEKPQQFRKSRSKRKRQAHIRSDGGGDWGHPTLQGTSPKPPKSTSGHTYPRELPNLFPDSKMKTRLLASRLLSSVVKLRGRGRESSRICSHLLHVRRKLDQVLLSRWRNPTSPFRHLRAQIVLLLALLSSPDSTAFRRQVPMVRLVLTRPPLMRIRSSSNPESSAPHSRG